MSDYEHLNYEQRGRVTVITINRPERMNAIGPQTHRELVDAWDRFRADDDALVGVLTGAGDRAFCAGGDLKATTAGELVDPSPAEVAAHNRGERPGVLGPSRWTDIYKPTIAAINGVAYAGGLEWACWTDLAIADEHATFGVTCRRWNIGLADGGTQRLTRILGYRRAIELIITGRVIDAHEAERIGLVNQVVPSGTCLTRALELADTIAALPQPALRTDLQAARTGQGHPLDEGLRIEAQCFNRSIFEAETFEGLRQFNDKGPPGPSCRHCAGDPGYRPLVLTPRRVRLTHRFPSACGHPIDAHRSSADRLPVCAAMPRLTGNPVRAKGLSMSDNSHAYNSVWQLRGDAWCRLEEAADRLTRTTTTGELKDQYTEICRELLTTLTPLEPYWAYPGSPQFAKVQRLFTAGNHDKFAHAVTRINRALTTESYRTGDVDTAGLDDTDMFPADPRTLEQQPVNRKEQLYFEVLVVEKMTEAQERALRKEVRSWRRPDDEFVYELVVVASGDEALIAARLNVNLQAVVIRRRFSHQSTRDLTTLAEFVDTRVSEELDDHKSPDERAQILAASLHELRPELDMYLMTEIDVEQIAGRLGPSFRRVFHAREGVLELHLSILHGVAERYRTPFFSALKQYSHRPTGVFHALPISQGKSIVNSHWIKDMVGFYGLDVFMAETSATCGGLDSLLEPTGPLREAQQLASEAYGSRHTYFVTNGTSTANKIVTQSLVAPGDIVLLDRNCHQSHHYGMMMAGANVVYLEAYPLPEYTMYGAVPLREIKSKLLALKRAGKLDRVKMMSLTNCTFDGIVYDVERVMEECLAIKPDLVFLWDEAWFAFARFHPVYRGRTAMATARKLRERLQDKTYRAEYDEYLKATSEHPPTDEELLNRRLIPDPAKARVRVYATQSTHKTLTSLRQGSMIHVFDQDFEQKVAEAFHEAYMAHTSTSPNYQILASLDLGRRQVALEGVELVQRQIENAMQLRDAIDNHPLLSKYMSCLRTSDLIPDAYRPSGIEQPLRSGLRNMMAAWDADEFVLDPSRITLAIGRTGYDGDTFKREQLMDRHGVQINKTSRNTVLFMTNIGTTRSSVAFLVEVLVKIAGELDESISEMGLGERGRFEQKVRLLTAHTASQPDFSGFHPVFRDLTGEEATPEGDVRRAFYLSYDDTNCEYLAGEEIDERLDAGIDVVSATFVTPYPPGFPVLVPGQVFSREILKFMRELDTPEIHGYKPEFGYRVYTEKAIEMCRPTQATQPALAQAVPPASTQAPEPAPPQPSKSKKSNGNRPAPTEPADALN